MENLNYKDYLDALHEIERKLDKLGLYVSGLSNGVKRQVEKIDKNTELKEKQFKNLFDISKIKNDVLAVQDVTKRQAELTKLINEIKNSTEYDDYKVKYNVDMTKLEARLTNLQQFSALDSDDLHELYNQLNSIRNEFITDLENVSAKDKNRLAEYWKRGLEAAERADELSARLTSSLEDKYKADKKLLDTYTDRFNEIAKTIEGAESFIKENGGTIDKNGKVNYNSTNNSAIDDRMNQAIEDLTDYRNEYKKLAKEKDQAYLKEKQSRKDLLDYEANTLSNEEYVKKLQENSLEYYRTKREMQKEYNELNWEYINSQGAFSDTEIDKKYGMFDEKGNFTNKYKNGFNDRNAARQDAWNKAQEAYKEQSEKSKEKNKRTGLTLDNLGKSSSLYKLNNLIGNLALTGAYKSNLSPKAVNFIQGANKATGVVASTIGGMGNIVGTAAQGAGGTLGSAATKLMNLIPAIKKLFTTSPTGAIISILTSILKIVDAGFKKAIEAMEKYAELQTTYYAKINTRLMGTGLTFDKLAGTFSDVFGTNPYISQQKLLENMSALVESGVVYNLEQRSILATLSDRMVSTFSMLDQTLTGLTKLYQTDLSVSALGIEGLITNFLNKTFEDNSYMSEVYDTVASNLYEAMSQFTEVEESSEFMYSVQKWLGSLYSVGMSSEGVNLLAQGINMLATGDVEGFNGNDSLRNLFALATNGSYADYLVNGFRTADEVNELLYTIIEYLANISEDSNQVTKKVNAGIFGNFKLSDIKSIQNLTGENSELLTKIYNENQGNWNNTVGYVSNVLLSNVADNTSEAQLWNNVADNFMFTLGESIMNSQVGIGSHKINAYSAYKVGKMLGLDDIATAAIGITNLGKIIDAVKDAGGSVLDIFQGDTSQLLNSYNNAYAIDTTSGIVDNGVLMKKVVNDYTKKKLSARSYGGTTNYGGNIAVDLENAVVTEINSANEDKDWIIYDYDNETVKVHKDGITYKAEFKKDNSLFGTEAKYVEKMSEYYGVDKSNIKSSTSSSNVDSIVNSSYGSDYRANNWGSTTLNNNSSTNVSSSTSTNSADITSSTKYNNDYDTEVQKTLTENAKTVATSSAVYSEENQSIIRSVNDIYAALFEDKLIIRVALAEVETKAQSSLAISNGAVNVYSTGGKLASVDSVNSLTKINNTVTVTSVR